MKAEDSQTNIVVIMFLLIAIPIFFAATSIGNLSLRYLVSAVVPNRHVSEGIAKSFKNNPSQFEDVVKILEREAPSTIYVLHNKDDMKTTSVDGAEIFISKPATASCAALLDKYGLYSITKSPEGVTFATPLGPHFGDGHILIYSKQILKQIDPIFGREYFTLNDHWAIQLI